MNPTSLDMAFPAIDSLRYLRQFFSKEVPPSFPHQRESRPTDFGLTGIIFPRDCPSSTRSIVLSSCLKWRFQQPSCWGRASAETLILSLTPAIPLWCKGFSRFCQGLIGKDSQISSRVVDPDRIGGVESLLRAASSRRLSKLLRKLN